MLYFKDPNRGDLRTNHEDLVVTMIPMIKINTHLTRKEIDLIGKGIDLLQDLPEHDCYPSSFLITFFRPAKKHFPK
jgi:hypothetical protein